MYSITAPCVSSAVTRFYRMVNTSGLEHVAQNGDPIILISNHQNGLMDPLVHVSQFVQYQIHWLTRADIFHNPIVRKILFGYNMVPVYRVRDRMKNTNDSNLQVFKVLVERLELGAVVGLYPEGNHQGSRGLRPLKGGVVRLLTLAMQTYPSLSRIQLIPVGLDYEQYDGFQRRFSYRMGKPIPIQDLWDKSKEEFPIGAMIHRIEEALRALMVDIQPTEHYGLLEPFVRALRSTEQTDENWDTTNRTIRSLSSIEADGFAAIQVALDSVNKHGTLEVARPEDLGLSAQDRRRAPWWTVVAAPFALALALPSLPLMFLIQVQTKKRISDICFKSTAKSVAGLFLFPGYWALQGGILAILVADDGWSWTWLAGWFFGNLFASRLAGSWYGYFLDFTGARKARKAWSQPATAQAWSNYVGEIQKHTHTS